MSTEASNSGTIGSDWVHVRSPFVYWAQTESVVTLRVDIQNAQNPRILIEENKVSFDAPGRGGNGESDYHFELELPHSINPKASTYRVLERDVNILLQKESSGWWQKVTLSHKKPAWLKVDFDRWKSQDDDDMVPQDVMKDFPGLLESLKQEEFGYKMENLRNVYLFMYNMFQLVMNLYIIGVLSVRWSRDGPATFHKAYDLVGYVFSYAQLLQCLEILHSVFGFTKSSLLPSFLQVVGRLVILFGLIASEERIQEKPVVFFLFYIWSLADIIRYPYYMLQISKKKFYAVTWLRYSAWILLYPAGLACEAVIIFGCIPFFVESERYSVSLPNKWNATFYFPTLMRCYLLFGLFPIAYSLMQNMKRGRAKVLKSREKPIKKSD